MPKHTGLNKKQGYAAKKVTGNHTVIDWAYLAKKHKSSAKRIKAHKGNQVYLWKLKGILEKTK